MSKVLKLLLGLILSFFCLFALFKYAGSFRIEKVFFNIDHIYLFPFALSVICAQLFIGCRYFLLLGKDIPFPFALCISILGNSANLLLPARGGELLKLHLSRKRSSIGYLSLLSRIFFERSLDLCFSLSLGMLALGTFLMGDGARENLYPLIQKIFIAFSFLFLLMLVGLFLIKKRLASLLKVLRKIAGIFKKEAFIENHIAKELSSLASFISWSNVKGPLLLSACIWLAFHPLGFISIAYMQKLGINYTEALFLASAVAISFLLPSLPSGLGVFHAALSSSLVLLGHPMEKGLAYAFLSHAYIFLVLNSLGLCAWVYFNFFLKKKGEKKESLL